MVRMIAPVMLRCAVVIAHACLVPTSLKLRIVPNKMPRIGTAIAAI